MAWGWDDNVREAMEKDQRHPDRFLRLYLEGSQEQMRYRAYAAGLRLRALTERYLRYADDSRLQVEGNIELLRRLGRGGSLWANGRLERRVYPDSTPRNFSRDAFSIGLGAPCRGGRLNIGTSTRGIDYQRTRRFDRRGQAFTIDYRKPLSPRWEANAIAEFEWAHWGRSAIKQVTAEAFELRGDQEDRGREARFGIQYVRGWLYGLTLAWGLVRSNSFGYSVTRRSVEGQVHGWLPGALLFQVRGRVEGVAFHDRGLGRVFVIRTGEDVEAGQDNNALYLRVRRALSSQLAVEGRASWFRNESLLIGTHYHKMVGSLGVVWSPIGASDS